MIGVRGPVCATLMDEAVRWLTAADALDAAMACGVHGRFLGQFGEHDHIGEHAEIVLGTHERDRALLRQARIKAAPILALPLPRSRTGREPRRLDAEIRFVRDDITEPGATAEQARQSGLIMMTTGMGLDSRGCRFLRHCFGISIGLRRSQGRRGRSLVRAVSDDILGMGAQATSSFAARHAVAMTRAVGGGMASPFWHCPAPDVDFTADIDALIERARIEVGTAEEEDGAGNASVVSIRMIEALRRKGGPGPDRFLLADALARARRRLAA